MSQYGYGPVDAELLLRDIAAGEVGKTTNGTPIALDFDSIGDFRAVVNVEGINDPTTDTEWALAIQVDTSVNFGSPVTLWSESNVSEEGVRAIPLSGQFVLSKEPGATHMRIVATQTGSGGDLLFGAHLVDMK
jgi:hypothetical protein